MLERLNVKEVDDKYDHQFISADGEGEFSEIVVAQHYGFATNPPEDSRAYVDYNEENVALLLYSPDHRPTNLQVGEVLVHGIANKDNPHRIIFKADGSIEILQNNGSIILNDKITIKQNDTQIVVKDGEVNIKASKINIQGDVNVSGKLNASTLTQNNIPVEIKDHKD